MEENFSLFITADGVGGFIKLERECFQQLHPKETPKTYLPKTVSRLADCGACAPFWPFGKRRMLLVGKVADECCLWERLRTNAACGKGCEKKTLKAPRSAHPQSPSRKRKGSSSNHHFPGAMFFNPPPKNNIEKENHLTNYQFSRVWPSSLWCFCVQISSISTVRP